MRQAARPGIFLVWVGDGARAWTFSTAHNLRRSGISVEMEGEKKSLKSQMRRADKLRARYVLIVGDEELGKGIALLRNMDTKEQSELKLDGLQEKLLERLTSN